MKIVAISDIHTLHEKMVHPIPDGDVLIVAGDWTNTGTFQEIGQFAHWLERQPHKHKIIIAGNHEREVFKSYHSNFDEATKTLEAIFAGIAIVLHRKTIEIDGIKFYGEPCSPEFFDWGWMYQRGAEAKKIWSNLPENIDVLITHGPPFGYGDKCPDILSQHILRRVGCEAQLQAIKKKRPKLVICGHIHESQGIYITNFGTTVANVAICNGRYEPVNRSIEINI